MAEEKKIINDIIKSSEDKRLYRGLILPNQLRVLLISDPETDKSAAALSVAVGHLSNPDDLPGLAHFCEHMLFLGSEKYPNENDYRKFIVEHGGNYNAFTSADTTMYHFDVASHHLKDALDIFAQFFLCPLMTDSAVEREVNAINSEHEKNLANDFCRLYQMVKCGTKNGHPYSKFGTGNKMSLFTIPQEKGIDVREELLNFHEKWYSANIMVLVVLGKESLEDLEEMVDPLFSEVANKNVVRPEWTDHPYGPDQVRTKMYIVPVKDTNDLNICFPIPDLCEYYKAKPARYLAGLIGHEGHGCLLSVLKAKAWINVLNAGCEAGAKGFGFFTITIELTDVGMENVDEIMTFIFQYLNMLREVGVQKWFFDESQKIEEIDFRYQGKKSPEDYVVETAEKAHKYEYPIQDMLCGPYLIQEWRPDLIDMLLSDYLKPCNVKIFLTGKKFDSIVDEVEPWYGTKYKLEKIPDDTIQKWDNCGVNDELKLPVPNEFIPSNFEIFCNGDKDGTQRHPLIKHDDRFLRVWLKQDDEFLSPKADLKFEFLSPLAFFDPLNHNLAYMFIMLLADSLNEYTYYASLAGLFRSFDIADYGFSLDVQGYNDKQIVFLDKILEKMTDFKIDPQRFHIIKMESVRRLKNFKAYEPHEQIWSYLHWMIAEKAWTYEEQLAATEQVTVERLEEFIPQLLSKLYVECLIHGNVDQESAHSLIQILKKRLVPKISQPLLPQELLRYREIKLNDGEYFVREIPTEFHKSSCIETYYQCCALSTENNMLTELLGQVLEEPYFDILRTKEQLGYGIYCDICRSDSAQGLRIVVQSDKHPDFLDHRIEAFLIRMREIIKDMTEEEFERNKEALAAVRLEKPKHLTELTDQFWKEISSQQYNFNRDQLEVEYLRTISKDELIKYFDDYVRAGGPKRRKLSVHMISQTEGRAGAPASSVENVAGSLPIKIEDVTKFKRSHGLYPLTEPFIDISALKAD